ncbi:MAG: hypothetical protein M1817_005588 [Caeruleum heppii]|nr:MAG: hypothetical protein M1817_005588 [Caeruleum heppii]
MPSYTRRINHLGCKVLSTSFRPFSSDGQSKQSCREGAEYVTALLEREDLPKRTRTYLNLLDDKYDEVLAASDEPSEDLRDEIDALEGFWNEHCRQIDKTSSEHSIRTDLGQHLKEVKFLATMGDYLETLCDRLKLVEYSGWPNPFCHYQLWTEVWADLQEDDQGYRSWLSDGAGTNERPSTALRHATNIVAMQLGVSEDLIRFWIETYSDRNTLLKSGPKDHVRTIQWKELSPHVMRDYRDIGRIIPAARIKQTDLINETLEYFQDLMLRELYLKKEANTMLPERDKVRPEDE